MGIEIQLLREKVRSLEDKCRNISGTRDVYKDIVYNYIINNECNKSLDVRFVSWLYQEAKKSDKLKKASAGVSQNGDGEEEAGSSFADHSRLSFPSSSSSNVRNRFQTRETKSHLSRKSGFDPLNVDVIGEGGDESYMDDDSLLGGIELPEEEEDIDDDEDPDYDVLAETDGDPVKTETSFI